MAKDYEEKRLFPRIKASFEVDIPKKNIPASSVDLSEGGLSMIFSETISSPKMSLQMHFPETDLKVEAKLVWKRDLETGSSLYGMEFVDLSDDQKSDLRRELIKTQIKPLINEIDTLDTQKQISHFFLKDILDYINEINKLALNLMHQKEYSLELEKKFDHLNTQILLKGYCLEELLADKRIMQKVKENFRQLLGVWIYKSMCMKHGFEKPRGYPGDYKMLEIVYDNKPISKGIGEYLDNYFLKSAYAVAVRIRKDCLRGLLLRFINGSKLDKIDIFNIACGSSREIKELLPDIKNKNPIIFTCLDWDEEALKFSQDILSSMAPKNVEFKFVKEDIMNMIKTETGIQPYGKQDLIYSIGLIDYLPDRILKKLIQVLYQFLRKDGKLILTHKNREKTFPSIPPDWACDWKFVSRNKEEVIKLFYSCEISEFSLSTDSDDFEYVYYFTITKT